MNFSNIKRIVVNSFFVVGIMSASACIGAGINSEIQSTGKGYFPKLTGIDLLGNERNIPSSFAGDLNIVVVGFEREHQTPINTWISSMEGLMSEFENLKFYEVPLIYEVSAPYRTWINNGMRAGIADEASRKRTITVYSDRQKVMSILEMNQESIYLFLLDSNGKVLWKIDGPATEDKLNILESKIIEASMSKR